MPGKLNHSRSQLVSGLQQRCVLPPILFIVYMNWIDSHSWVEEGVTVGSYRINGLLFADDLVLLASSQQHLQHALGQFSAAHNWARMKIATKKQGIICLSRSRKKPKAVYAANEQQCTARGGEVQVPWGGTYEWRKAKRKDNTVLHELYRSVVTKWELSNTTKLSLFKLVFVPILTYGHESWVMTEKIISQV